MMKLLASIGVLVIALAVIIFGIGAYLGPDGLGKCGDYPTTQQDCRSVDAIVAISGGDTPARTEQAITMFKHGWAPLLVFSGAAADKTGPSNARAMKRQALNEGIPSDKIILDETSETTSQNATNATNLFEHYGIHSVILVTSAYHQRRAGLEFGKHAGMSIKIVNHPVKSDDQWSPYWWWATPTGWYLAISELVKIAAFYTGGGQ